MGDDQTQIALKIITPNQEQYSDFADMFVLPSIDGEMGILKAHYNTVVPLKSGFIRLYKKEQVINQIFVFKAIAHVDGINCTIMAENFSLLSDLNINMIKEKLSNLQDSQDDEQIEYYNSVIDALS